MDNFNMYSFLDKIGVDGEKIKWERGMAKIIEELKLNFDDVLIVPKESSIDSRKDVDLNVSFTFPHSKATWNGIPLIAANMTTVASFEMANALAKHNIMTAIHKYYSVEELTKFFNTSVGHNYAWYTLGTNSDDWNKFKKVNSNNIINKICIDVANGYRDSFVDAVKRLRDENPNITIMAGNVVTPEQTSKLINAGADVCKIGIGSSAICITRLKAGCGVPQFSAIIECSEAAYELNAFICSDGGCKIPGDICKAFGAMSGKNFVMLGSMLAGHNETGAKKVIDSNGNELVEFYGMSSEKAMQNHNNGMNSYRSSEGRHILLPSRGSVENTILDILGSLRSCCTYTNSKTLDQLPENTTFIKVNETHNRNFERFDKSI